jgi:hypothetical protein
MAMLPFPFGQRIATAAPQPAVTPAATPVRPSVSPTPSAPAVPVTSLGPSSPGNGNGSGNPPPPPSGGGGVTLPPHLPLRFEANQGQKDARVQFQARANGYNVFLTATEMVLALDKPQRSSPPQNRRLTTPPLPATSFVVRMQLVGATSTARLTGVGQLPGVTHYFRSNNQTGWLRNIPSYGQVAYQGVYPGIDVLYYANASQQLEYDFTVAPTASPSTIQLAFTGATTVYVGTYGDLVLNTPFGDVVEHAPIAYQTVNSCGLCGGDV